MHVKTQRAVATAITYFKRFIFKYVPGVPRGTDGGRLETAGKR